MELIDFEKKGNVVRLYFGKNGEQTGDDWDDAPYEHNAGIVYYDYVKSIYDMYIPFDIDVVEQANEYYPNSPYCKNDLINRELGITINNSTRDKSYPTQSLSAKHYIIPIFFGDTLEYIKSKTEKYNVKFEKVK